jgi:hypothetical protein
MRKRLRDEKEFKRRKEVYYLTRIVKQERSKLL